MAEISYVQDHSEAEYLEEEGDTTPMGFSTPRIIRWQHKHPDPRDQPRPLGPYISDRLYELRGADYIGHMKPETFLRVSS